MQFDLNILIRENIRVMKPYSSARSEYTGSDHDTIFLDANEQPEPFEGLPSGINRYPRHNQEALKCRLAHLKGVEEDQVFLGNGSDEAIDLILRCFANPGVDSVMVFPPTFGMYGVSAAMNDLALVRVPLDKNFHIDSRAALDAIAPQTKVMFVCSPNNPSGNVQSRETIVALLKGFRGLVVVDEAYADFAPHASMLPLLNDYPNLIVLQTFSKAWGLAGARIGMAYASKEIVAILNKVRFPYNVSLPNSRLAIDALNRYTEYSLNVAATLARRKQLIGELLQLPTVEKIYPSDANFLLIKTSDGNGIYHHLREQGVIVRNRGSEPGCESCLRITVGTDEENSRLLHAWKAFSGTGTHVPEQQSKSESIIRQPETILSRKATVNRATSETDILVRLNLDGSGIANISTGIGFFDHMLHQIARHGLFDLELLAKGDLHIDAHHTVEDTAITLGQAFRKALGNKAGIERYGFVLPMDEAHARVLIDFGGRIYFRWKVKFLSPQCGELQVSLFEHFFRSFAEAAGVNLHIKAKGTDDHHKIEAVFKAFAKALKMAVQRNQSGMLPSTKGSL